MKAIKKVLNSFKKIPYHRKKLQDNFSENILQKEASGQAKLFLPTRLAKEKVVKLADRVLYEYSRHR